MSLTRLIEEIKRDVQDTSHTYESLMRPNVNTHPIPFFGNPITAEIITIGVNPSADEFIDRQWPDVCPKSYLENRLKNYFHFNVPCHPFFNRWEECLNILGFSYSRNAIHIDLSPRATRSMGSITDSELFIDMIRNDIMRLKDFLNQCTRAKLILTAGTVTNRYWLYECFTRNFTNPEHGLYLEGDTRRLKGSPWSKLLQLHTPTGQLPLFFTTTGAAARRNPHNLRDQIKLWKTNIIKEISKKQSNLKTLYLLRHAEADNKPNDLDRDLTLRGHRHAESIGRWMSEKGIMPDRIISSPVKRAMLTAKICLEKAGLEGFISFKDELYDTFANTYVDLLAVLNKEYDSVMIVGHNPEISEAITIFTGEYITMSPCTLACIEFDHEKWNSLEKGKGLLKWVQVPS